MKEITIDGKKYKTLEPGEVTMSLKQLITWRQILLEMLDLKYLVGTAVVSDELGMIISTQALKEQSNDPTP